MVYVLNKNGNAIMPTKRYGHVRYLLNNKKAVVVNNKPFTIKLKYEVDDKTQPLILGIDPGRTNIGVSVLNEQGEEIYAAHVSTRNKDIVKLIKKRAAYRRASRKGERKVRQRRAVKNGTIFKDGEIQERILPGCKEPIQNHFIVNAEARFMNRKRPLGWLTPSAKQLVLTHINVVKKLCSILPISDVCVEYNRFAFMKMDDGTIKGLDFQNGRMKGYKSVNEYAYALQDGKCAICGAPIEHYHHLEAQHKNGSGTPENIVGLCSCCHTAAHTQKVAASLLQIGKKKQYAALSVLNQAMPYILDETIALFGEGHTHTCVGYDTKQIRERVSLQKTHNIDAACIAASVNGVYPKVTGDAYEIQQFRRHDRAIIHSQRERTYKLNGKTVAKNRKTRFEQKDDSLQTHLNALPLADRRKVCSQMKVTPSTRHYNNPDRNFLPGSVFYYNDTRYVMSGQSNGGIYLRALGYGDTNFKASKCRIQQNRGIVYL
ncbi:MAG: RRXRR domain-containing protein [Ruthenibacterium sp.]